MYFDVFLTKSVVVNENLGVERHQRGLNPNPPGKSSTAVSVLHECKVFWNVCATDMLWDFKLRAC